jgi:hypothetical protein
MLASETEAPRLSAIWYEGDVRTYNTTTRARSGAKRMKRMKGITTRRRERARPGSRAAPRRRPRRAARRRPAASSSARPRRACRRRRRGCRPRVRSHCRFRNRAADYLSEYGMKCLSGGTKRQCNRTLCRPPGRGYPSPGPPRRRPPAARESKAWTGEREEQQDGERDGGRGERGTKGARGAHGRSLAALRRGGAARRREGTHHQLLQLAGGGRRPRVRGEAVDSRQRHCPGREPPFLAAKRPQRPKKCATQNRFTVKNAKAN